MYGTSRTHSVGSITSDLAMKINSSAVDYLYTTLKLANGTEYAGTWYGFTTGSTDIAGVKATYVGPPRRVG